MKKILSLALAFLFIANLSAQDDKKIRFGLSAAPSLNWYKTDLSTISYDGLGIGFQWGLDLEYKINNIASIYTGLKLANDNGKLAFRTQDSVGYRINDRDEFVTDTALNFNLLTNRNYKANYVTIPFGVKMKTNEIGYMTYFGQFGLLTSIRTKAKANDIILADLTNNVNKDKLNIDDDMQLFKMQLSVGGGAEYNMSGSTSIVFGVNYNLGFTNVLKKNSKHIESYSTSEAFNQTATAHNVMLTVGILF